MNNNIDLFDKLVSAILEYVYAYTNNKVSKSNYDTFNDERGRALQALGKCVEVQVNFPESIDSLKKVELHLQNSDETNIGQVLYFAYLAKSQANLIPAENEVE